jgi:hypothetical protein
MARYKNNPWELPEGKLQTWEQVNSALLMDIRDELQAIRHLMECPNIQKGFIAMQQVAKNTKRKPRKKK